MCSFTDFVFMFWSIKGVCVFNIKTFHKCLSVLVHRNFICSFTSIHFKTVELHSLLISRANVKEKSNRTQMMNMCSFTWRMKKSLSSALHFINKRGVDQVSTGRHRLFARHEFFRRLKKKTDVITYINPKKEICRNDHHIHRRHSNSELSYT